MSRAGVFPDCHRDPLPSRFSRHGCPRGRGSRETAWLRASPDAARREKHFDAISRLKSFSRQCRATGMPAPPTATTPYPPLEGGPGGQIDSRSAFAAACRRSLTSASSRAAISIRSCCASERSCWRSARFCSLSARSLLSLSRSSIAATVRVRSATCAAMLAMSSSEVTPAGVYAENLTLVLGLGS